MDRSYSDYIDIIDEVENIEQVIITDNRCKKVCFYTLELIKLGIQYIKNQNVNININGKRKTKRIKQILQFLQQMTTKKKKLLKKHQLLSLLALCVKRC